LAKRTKTLNKKIHISTYNFRQADTASTIKKEQKIRGILQGIRGKRLLQIRW
jgi:hypothetical protein